MGGFNSGNHGGKRTTGDMHTLDVRRLQRDGLLTPGASFGWQWTRNGNKLASINIMVDSASVTLGYRTKQPDGTWLDMDYPVRIERTACNLGGSRAWWLCPCCGRRVAVIYGGKIYACRQCQHLTYQSTRDAADTKAFARADAVRKRLGWAAGIAHPQGDKPKGMHRQTYWRWLTVYNTLAMRAIGASHASLEKLTGRLHKINLAADKYEV
jgi:hypothetical protein